MTKKEIKESQDSLLVLLPNNIRNTKEITRSTKILLGALIFLNGMDKAKENGYVFRSNKQLEEDTNLSNKTIITSISHLINLDFITRSTGNRVEGASTYILNFEAINAFQGCNFKGVKSEENYTYKLHLSDGCKNQITPINYTDNIEEKINKLTLEISELRNDINVLKDLIIGEIKGVNQGCNFKGVISNYTTDTDIDTEIDNNINNITDLTGTIEENNDIVVEDTTNDIDDLLSMDNVIEVGDVTIHTFIPTNEGLFIPDVDTTNDITSTDSVDINTNVEVCDCSEQREEQKTNDINENKQQVEMRSADNLTSTDGIITATNTHFNEEAIIISSNGENETPFNSNSQGYITPQPPTIDENANKAVLSHVDNADNKSISRSDETRQDANKRANLGYSDNVDKYAEIKAVFETANSQFNNGTDEEELDNIFLPIYKLIQSQNAGDFGALDYIADNIDELINKIQNWFDSDKIDIITNTAIGLLRNKK